jgi:hypothetical protein
VLCQLSYAPRRFEDGHCSLVAVRAPSQRRALGALFAFLTVLFAGIAIAALIARVWPVAIAAAALSPWLLSTAARALR